MNRYRLRRDAPSFPWGAAVRAALTIAWFTALEAGRGRIVWLLAGAALAGSVFALLAGELAITETRGFRAGLLGAWLRSCAVLVAVAFTVASMVREIDDKGIDLVLSMPVPRGAYCAGKLAGLAVVPALSACACALALAWCAPPAQVAIWAASLYLELLIVTAMCVLCAFTFCQITWALATVVGFYVLSRAMAALQLMADARVHEPLAAPASVSGRLVGQLVDAIAFVLPDLDRFTESSWLIHGDGTMADLRFAAMQAAVYTALLGAAALFDLHRKAL